MQGALHLFTQPKLCKLPNYYHRYHQKPSIQQYVATRRTTLHLQQILDLEASVCRMGGTDFCILPLIMLTAPDSAVTVVVRHHPIEGPLQLSRLRRVFHLLCVQHLHKSKLIPAIVACSCSSAPQQKTRMILRASV
jgi:hypothetical protein